MPPLQISISNVIGCTDVLTPPVPPSPFSGILLSGTWTSPQNRLYATLKTGNTPYTVWNTNIGTGISNYFHCSALTATEVLLGGYFTSYNGVASNYFVILNRATGARISSGLGTGFNDSVRFIHVQSDGKIICAGSFISYNGVSRNRLVRLNTDYTIDATFNVGAGLSGGACEYGVVDDTHLYLVGAFTTYKGVARQRFVKIRLSDGTDDTGLNPTFTAALFTIYREGDSLYIGGNSFTSYRGAPTPTSICKIDKNTLVQDSTFNTNMGTGANGRVFFNIDGDNSGSIYFSGNFTTINGTARNQLAKISTNGILQPAVGFSPSGGSVLFTSLFLDKTKMFISGGFTNVNPRFVVLDVATNTVDTAYNVSFPSGLGTTCMEF